MIYKLKSFIANATLRALAIVFQLLIFFLAITVVTILVTFIVMVILINLLTEYINKINGDSNVPIAGASG